MIQNPVLGFASPVVQKNNMLLQVNDLDFQSPNFGAIFTKTPKKSPVHSSKNIKSAIKFVTEVS